MKRILVTGGAGYLGTVLVGHLLRRGYRVTVLDNLMYAQDGMMGFAGHSGFDFVRGDARDEGLIGELLKGHDAILPLAAIVGAPACERDPLLSRGVNYDSIVLLNRLRRPDQPVIWPCSNSGYGTKSGDVYCTEETPMEPITLYGETKVAAERELLGSPNTISLRLATVFGPSARMRLDLLVNDFVHRAVTDGYLVIYEKDFKRNYVHIDDVAECFCHCLERFEEMKGQAYNVGLEGANLSKSDLAEKIKAFVPKLYVHYAEVGSDPDRRNYVVSNEKLARCGFTAKRTLDQGIGELLKLYRAMPRMPFRNA